VLWQSLLFILKFFNAEALHHFTVKLLQAANMIPGLIRIISATPKTVSPLAFAQARSENDTANNLLPLGFSTQNPVGLAAGFDKNCEILDLLPALGFGFAEIGTVTLAPQSGNAKPRLFRNYTDQTIFNRMGFNNLGAKTVSANLERKKTFLPSAFSTGVNLGKNKDTSDQNAASEYAKVASFFLDLADYFVINVSSPNTPGLRNLQNHEHVSKIFSAVKNTTQSRTGKPIPVFVKLAPEIQNLKLTQLITSLDAHGVDGFVLGNTLAGTHQTLTGGWSGAMLTQISKHNLRTARAVTKKPIISVGGISTPEDAAERLNEGASALQIYTGWIMKGPRLPSQICKKLHLKNTPAL